VVLEKDTSSAAEAESLAMHTTVPSDFRARTLLVIEADQGRLESVQAFQARQGMATDMPFCPVHDLLHGVERRPMVTEDMSETVRLRGMP